MFKRMTYEQELAHFEFELHTALLKIKNWSKLSSMPITDGKQYLVYLQFTMRNAKNILYKSIEENTENKYTSKLNTLNEVFEEAENVYLTTLLTKNFFSTQVTKPSIVFDLLSYDLIEARVIRCKKLISDNQENTQAKKAMQHELNSLRHFINFIIKDHEIIKKYATQLTYKKLVKLKKIIKEKTNLTAHHNTVHLTKH